MKAHIVTLPGDGVGPEVTAAAVAVLKAVARHGGHEFQFEEHAIGGTAIDAFGEPLPAASLDACRRADAVLLGAVGGPKWSDPNAKVRPEQGLLGLERRLLASRLHRRAQRLQPRPTASPVKKKNSIFFSVLWRGQPRLWGDLVWSSGYMLGTKTP